MRKLVVYCIIVTLFLWGCAQKKFNPTLAGEITYSRTTWEDGRNKYVICSIPADEVQRILHHMVPRGDKYSEYILVFGSQDALMQYGGRGVKVNWSMAKVAKPIIFLTITGYESYVLEEPYASEFLEALNKNEKKTGSLPSNTVAVDTVDKLITENKAIELAKKACVGKLEIPADAPVAVELKDKIYIVTFKTQWPKGTMGGDYYARVSINAVSGEVLEILGSD